jgi:L-serine/L-threonine ammonia-lyase
MAHLCHTLQQEKGVQQLISSSGGNAGLAVAVAGAQLVMQVQVIVPTTTKQLVIDKLQRLGADVTVFGENWNAA